MAERSLIVRIATGETDCVFELMNGHSVLSLLFVDFAQTKVSARKVGIDLNCLFQRLDRVLVLAGERKGPSGVAADDEAEGGPIETDCLVTDRA